MISFSVSRLGSMSKPMRACEKNKQSPQNKHEYPWTHAHFHKMIASFCVGFYYLCWKSGLTPWGMAWRERKEEDEENERSFFRPFQSGAGIPEVTSTEPKTEGKEMFFFFRRGTENQCARRTKNREINHCVLISLDIFYFDFSLWTTIRNRQRKIVLSGQETFTVCCGSSSRKWKVSVIASNAMTPHTCFWRHFVAKKFAFTIFTWGSLWVETLFFLLLFDRSCRFPRCSNSKLSLSIPSVVQSKNVGRDMNTHLRRRSYAPRQTAPLGPNDFLSKTLSRPALEVNRSSPKIAGQGAHYGIASQYHWVSKKHQKQLPSFTLRAAKKQTNHQDFDVDVPAASKDTFFFDFGGRLLDRWCSSSLALFSSVIYSCQGDLAACFTCLHQSKQAKKAHVVYEPWPSNMHAACAA